jgi:hypothetical protein
VKKGEEQNAILESVVADKEGTSVEKVLQAVKRTEATLTEKKWNFFKPREQIEPLKRELPPCSGWQELFLDPLEREHMLLSGFAKDMIMLGEALPKDLFLWMLDEVCFESRSDLRQAYGEILGAASEQTLQYLKCKDITNMLRKLGAKEDALDLNADLIPATMDLKANKQEMEFLGPTIDILGKLSENTEIDTSIYILSILSRLCVDSVIWENIDLLNAVQRAMVRVCNNIDGDDWQQAVSLLIFPLT